MTISSFCRFDSPQCVEVRGLDGEWITVRSTERVAVSVGFTREEWTTFIDGVKAGEFDLKTDRGLEMASQLEQT